MRERDGFLGCWVLRMAAAEFKLAANEFVYRISLLSATEPTKNTFTRLTTPPLPPSPFEVAAFRGRAIGPSSSTLWYIWSTKAAKSSCSTPEVRAWRQG